jgi:hypothetical protein
LNLMSHQTMSVETGVVPETSVNVYQLTQPIARDEFIIRRQCPYLWIRDKEQKEDMYKNKCNNGFQRANCIIITLNFYLCIYVLNSTTRDQLQSQYAQQKNTKYQQLKQTQGQQKRTNK